MYLIVEYIICFDLHIHSTSLSLHSIHHCILHCILHSMLCSFHWVERGSGGLKLHALLCRHRSLAQFAWQCVYSAMIKALTTPPAAVTSGRRYSAIVAALGRGCSGNRGSRFLLLFVRYGEACAVNVHNLPPSQRIFYLYSNSIEGCLGQ